MGSKCVSLRRISAINSDRNFGGQILSAAARPSGAQWCTGGGENQRSIRSVPTRQFHRASLPPDDRRVGVRPPCHGRSKQSKGGVGGGGYQEDSESEPERRH